eukprot:5609033-Pleurochrysis_carterae.AAC.2
MIGGHILRRRRSPRARCKRKPYRARDSTQQTVRQRRGVFNKDGRRRDSIATGKIKYRVKAALSKFTTIDERS